MVCVFGGSKPGGGRGDFNARLDSDPRFYLDFGDFNARLDSDPWF